MGTWTTFDPATGSCILPDPETVINPFAIASGEAFGAVTANNAIILLPTAISSLETFGTPSMLPVLSPVAIATAEAFGSPQVSLNVTLLPTAITSAEAFGTPDVVAVLTIDLLPTAIASAEAFGAAGVTVEGQILVPSIASAEAFGSPNVFEGSLLFPNATEPYTVVTDFTVHNGGALSINGTNDRIKAQFDNLHFESFSTLSAAQKAVISLGRTELTMNIEMSSFTDADVGCMVVCYYNSSGTVIGTAARAYADYAVDPGESVVITSWVPADTDKIGMNWLHNRVAGTENSVYLGTFSGTFVPNATEDHTIIYSNGGTDVEGVQGATDDSGSWTNTTGTLVYFNTGIYDLDVIRGGTADSVNLAFREFAASAEELTAIAGGTAILHLDCHLNNQNNDDRIRLAVQGLNASDVVQIELETSASPVDYNSSGEMFSLTSGIIPSTVTKFRIEYDATRFDGTANDVGASYITARLEYTP